MTLAGQVENMKFSGVFNLLSLVICLSTVSSTTVFSLTEDAVFGYLSYVEFNKKLQSLAPKEENSSIKDLTLIYSVLKRNLDEEINIDEIQFTPLLGGFMNSAWKVAFNNKKFILRIPTSFGVYENQHRIYDFLKDNPGIEQFPKILFFDRETKSTAYEFLEGRHLSLIDLKDDTHLKNLAYSIKAMHQIPLEGKLRLHSIYNAFDLIDKYKSFAFESDIHEDIKRIYDLLKERYLQINRAPVLCHNDLYLNNVLFNDTANKFYFIDIDTMMPGNPLYDLASVISYNDLDMQESDTFLKAYGIEMPSKEYEEVKLLKDVNDLYLYFYSICYSDYFNQCMVVKYRNRLLKRYGPSI